MRPVTQQGVGEAFRQTYLWEAVSGVDLTDLTGSFRDPDNMQAEFFALPGT